MKRNISKIHYEILDPNRQELLNKLVPILDDFVLSGGTALALQINHRLSFDFDFFSKKEITLNLINKLKKIIKISTVLVNKPDELSFYDENNIKVSFIYYPFKNIFSFIELENGIKLFTLKEITAQKAYTIGRRGTYRDYFDIYTILKEGYSNLAEVMKNTQKIYSDVFNPKLFLSQLVYFDDLTNFEIIPIDSNQKLSNEKEVKLFLENEVSQYLKT